MGSLVCPDPLMPVGPQLHFSVASAPVDSPGLTFLMLLGELLATISHPFRKQVGRQLQA